MVRQQRAMRGESRSQLSSLIHPSFNLFQGSGEWQNRAQLCQWSGEEDLSHPCILLGVFVHGQHFPLLVCSLAELTACPGHVCFLCLLLWAFLKVRVPVCVCQESCRILRCVCMCEMELIQNPAYCTALFALTGAGGGCSSPGI